MSGTLESMFDDEPAAWLEALKPYQRTLADQLIAQGKSFDEVADAWLGAAAANTFPFGGSSPQPGRGLFRERLVEELEKFLCGGSDYEQERAGLFGKDSLLRTYIVGVIAVAIAPKLGVTAAFISPAIALLLASFGKISLNAWCAMRRDRKPAGGSA